MHGIERLYKNQMVLLHILVGDGQLERVPSNLRSLRLLIKSEGHDYTLSSSWQSGSIIRFHQTVHLPVLDKDKVTGSKFAPLSENDPGPTTRIAFDLIGTMTNGTEKNMGRTSCITSCLEHSVTKILTMHNASEALTGRLTVTFYYYRYPLDLSDRGLILTEEVISENKAHNISSREYAFLLSRKINWHGVRSASFNDYTERLVTADVTKNLKDLHESRKSLLSSKSSRDGKKVEESPSASLIRSTYSVSKKPWQVNKSVKGKSSKKEPIKTRTTVSAVGYAGVKWPEANQSNREKLIYKLHLAEERRLQLLKELKDEAVKKTKVLMKKANDVINKKKDKNDEKMLKAILKSKDSELKRLKENLVSFKMENIIPGSQKKTQAKRPLSASVSNTTTKSKVIPSSRPKSATSGIIIRSKEKASLKSSIPPKDGDAYLSLLKSAGANDITKIWSSTEPTLSSLSKQSKKKRDDDDDSADTKQLINDLGKTMDLSELQQVPWKPTISESEQKETIKWLKKATIAVNNLDKVSSEKRSISPWRDLLNSSKGSSQINLDDFKDDPHSPVDKVLSSTFSIKDIQTTMLNLDRKLAESPQSDGPSSASLLLKKLIDNPKSLDDMYDSDIDIDDIIAPSKNFDSKFDDNNSISSEDD